MANPGLFLLLSVVLDLGAGGKLGSQKGQGSFAG